MAPGTTFYLNGHLWVVISDPAGDEERVLCVQFNRWKRFLDQACVLDVGAHPFITERTCVNFQHAMLAPLLNLLTLMDSGDLTFREPATPELLNKILGGAEKSRLPQDYIALLIEQELI